MAVSEFSSDYHQTVITGFSPGSIVTETIILFNITSDITEPQLQLVLGTNQTIYSTNGINVSDVTVYGQYFYIIIPVFKTVLGYYRVILLFRLPCSLQHILLS